MKIHMFVLLALSFSGVAAQPIVGPAFGTTNAPISTLTRSNLPPAGGTFFRTLSVPGLGPPMLLNTNWALRTRVKGLDNPIAVAFLAAGDFFVIEKDTGRVKRFRPDLPEEIVLDLAVNSASER